MVSGYEVWCPKCGYKSCLWDGSGSMQFERQLRVVTFPNHLDHGTLTIFNEFTIKLKHWNDWIEHNGE